jgi:hypothetical protein
MILNDGVPIIKSPEKRLFGALATITADYPGGGKAGECSFKSILDLSN